MPERRPLEGRVAVVTGAAGEIGAATVALFASRGARVVAVDRPGTDFTPVSAAAETTFEADVTDEEAVRAYVAAAMTLDGRIDVLFNNAGVEGPVAGIPDYDLAAFRQVMAVNVEGVFLGLKHVMPVMAAQGSGSIVNCSSVAGLIGTPGMVAYTASKHAVLGVTRCAALEAAPKGFRVNCVHPGPIHSRMMASVDEGAGLTEEKRARAVPSGRYGRATEVAAVVGFLASDEAAYVNGAAYTVDGALTAM